MTNIQSLNISAFEFEDAQDLRDALKLSDCLKQLKYLNFNLSAIVYKVLHDVIEKMPNLTSLILENTAIRYNNPDESGKLIFNLKYLEVLSMEGCGFFKEISKAFGKFDNIGPDKNKTCWP